jgi:hypothetical protein
MAGAGQSMGGIGQSLADAGQSSTGAGQTMGDTGRSLAAGGLPGLDGRDWTLAARSPYTGLEVDSAAQGISLDSDPRGRRAL